MFAHNGTLEHGPILERLDDRHRATLEGQTDSEIFFRWLVQNIEHAGDVPAGLVASLSAVTHYTGLNFLLTDGKSLFAYRDASKTHEYYSLFILKRDPLDGQLERFTSAEVGALLRSKSLRGEKTVLICSERLTEEDWKPIELGHLVTISESLASTAIRIR